MAFQFFFFISKISCGKTVFGKALNCAINSLPCKLKKGPYPYKMRFSTALVASLAAYVSAVDLETKTQTK